MTELPEPLTPADCDLRGNDWMPLHGHKLYSSYFDAHATDAEWRAANKLWWAAWQEVPAASLPDDDVILCRQAGMARDLKSWNKIKAMALHGFVKCADGRLYHKFLADEAVKAFSLRLRSDKKRTADSERLRKWREDRKLERKTNGDGNAHETPNETPMKHDVKRVSSVVDKTGQDKERKNQPPTDSQSRPREPLPGPANDRFASLAEKYALDEKTGKTHPIVNGYQLDVVYDLVCDAGRLNPATFRGDMRPLVQWLKDDFRSDQILAAVTAVASSPSYAGCSTLKYFDKAVRERRA